MSALDKLFESKEFSKYTIKSYKTQFNKLTKKLSKDIEDATEKEVIEASITEPNINSQQALLNIALVIKRFLKQPSDEIELKRDGNKEGVKTHVKASNVKKEGTLPPLDSLFNHMDKMLEENKYREFIINYLLINLNTRNQDLNITFVDNKKDASGKDTNYMWVDRRAAKIVYIRNAYKTAGTYGSKTDVIKDSDFLEAVKKYRKADGNKLIPNEENTGHWVEVATLDKMGSGNYYKIVVNAFKNDLQKLKQIAEKRGSSLDTMAEHYDIDNK
jgi:hypothetical protein